MRQPVNINLSPEKPTVEKIKQSFYTVDEHNKFDLLLRLLKAKSRGNALSFAAASATADRAVHEAAAQAPGMAEAMHGDLQQSQRERIMADFRAAKVIIWSPRTWSAAAST